MQDQPYEIWCVCASCRNHRQAIRDREQGRNTEARSGFVGRPVLAPTPQVSIICRCELCAQHLLFIDQLAEKVGLGAATEVEHWNDVSFDELVVSDWQDILGKKDQAYWRWKMLEELAVRDRSTPINLEIVSLQHGILS